MGLDERALPLIESIYASAIEPGGWKRFAQELSDALGRASVAITMPHPDSELPFDATRVHLPAASGPIFVHHLLKGLPWGDPFDGHAKSRFIFASERLPDSKVAETDFYREYMQPFGLAPEGPICHQIATSSTGKYAAIVIYRRVGCRPFDDDDITLCNLLVPHLERGYAVYSRLGSVRRARVALAEVLDRLPTGVLVFDSQHAPLIVNRSARRILDLHDGFAIDRGRPRLADRREDGILQTLLAKACAATQNGRRTVGDVMQVSRPSGRRAFALMVAPLLDAPPGSAAGDAVSVAFLADPETGHISTTDVLEQLYSLTPAEAELVQLLAQGRSLEQVATARSVTMNTVRSQLKQVFTKTDTKRQGELVRLVLTGVSSIQD
ncbi:MAG TPA: helix-turn-helix transcriptional regulator [Myxococcota bacterium]|jgi:DNA-binding CsgD family transcriptional regulator